MVKTDTLPRQLRRLQPGLSSQQPSVVHHPHFFLKSTDGRTFVVDVVMSAESFSQGVAEAFSVTDEVDLSRQALHPLC